MLVLPVATASVERIFSAMNYVKNIFNRRVMRYEILDILEFTSDRKRMSVVVLDCQSGKFFLLSKGADEALLPCAYSGNRLNY